MNADCDLYDTVAQLRTAIAVKDAALRAAVNTVVNAPGRDVGRIAQQMVQALEIERTPSILIFDAVRQLEEAVGMLYPDAPATWVKTLEELRKLGISVQSVCK